MLRAEKHRLQGNKVKERKTNWRFGNRRKAVTGLNRIGGGVKNIRNCRKTGGGEKNGD